MQICNMLADYKTMCIQASSIGRFNAYKLYTEKYSSLFDSIFQYLYCCPIDSLKEYIESVDFNCLLKKAQQNVQQNICDKIIANTQKHSKILGIDYDFTLYLGLEMGNIGGTSLSSIDNHPFLYIGIDRELAPDFINMFLPHELNHMQRGYGIDEPVSMTLFSRMIAEGLASYTPIWLHKMEWNIENISKAMSLNISQVEYLLNNTQQIINRICDVGDVPITPQVMEEFFTMKDEYVKVCLPGYYVGMHLVHVLVSEGMDFAALCVMPTKQILQYCAHIFPGHKNNLL